MTHSARSDFTGRCLCGAVTFSGRIKQGEAPTACHCSQCRIWSGHYWASVSACDLVIAGQDALRWYRSSEAAMRGFCATCGSSLFWRETTAPKGHAAVAAAAVLMQAEVAAGAIDPPDLPPLASHIFVADKGSYYRIADGLPQFAQG